VKRKEINQGDIYIIKLDGIECEETGIRPCICISCDSLNKNRKNINIAPITSSETKKDMFNHYILLKKDYPFFTYKKNTVLLECVRDISRVRFEKYLGTISKEDLEKIIEKVSYNFKNIS
jgi:mRNA-degrading endonuclease toxin of MazEF toxin-antitoxin module